MANKACGVQWDPQDLMADQGTKAHLGFLGNLGQKAPRGITATWDPQVLWAHLGYPDLLVTRVTEEARGTRAILEYLRKCAGATVFTGPWTIWNTNLGNRDPRDLQVRMGSWDPRVRRGNLVKKEYREIMDPEGIRVTWDPWVYPVPWANPDPRVITDPQDFRVKWAPLGQVVKKVNVVIWAPWATMASKVKRVIRVTTAAGVTLDPQDPHAP